MSSSRRRGGSRSSTDRRGSRSIGIAGEPSVRTPSPGGNQGIKSFFFNFDPLIPPGFGAKRFGWYDTGPRSLPLVYLNYPPLPSAPSAHGD